MHPESVRLPSVGDLVRCVCAANHAWVLRKGAVYTVTGVWTADDGTPMIAVDGHAIGWPARQFEKVSS